MVDLMTLEAAYREAVRAHRAAYKAWQECPAKSDWVSFLETYRSASRAYDAALALYTAAWERATVTERLAHTGNV